MLGTAGAVVDGRYELIEAVPELGLGEVWRARDARIGQRTFTVELLGAVEDLARFEAQAKLLRRCIVPGAAGLLAHGVWQGVAYLALRPVEGQPLRVELAARRALDDRLAVFERVAECVSAAHRAPQPLLHGALSPEAVAVSRSSEGVAAVTVLDLGVAEVCGRGARQSAFLAPERRSGSAPTVAADVYSLGRLLAWLTEGDAPPRGAARPVAGVIARATADDSGERYATVVELLEALRRAPPAEVAEPTVAPAVAAAPPPLDASPVLIEHQREPLPLASAPESPPAPPRIDTSPRVEPPRVPVVGARVIGTPSRPAEENPWATEVRLRDAERRVEVPVASSPPAGPARDAVPETTTLAIGGAFGASTRGDAVSDATAVLPRSAPINAGVSDDTFVVSVRLGSTSPRSTSPVARGVEVDDATTLQRVAPAADDDAATTLQRVHRPSSEVATVVLPRAAASGASEPIAPSRRRSWRWWLVVAVVVVAALLGLAEIALTLGA